MPLPYPPTSATAGQVVTATRWNTEVKANFESLASLANDGTLAWDNTNKRLGVGTNTPADKLHVASATDAATRIETTNAANYALFRLKTPSRAYQFAVAGNLAFNANNLYIFEEVANATRLMITSTGSVLIGKTSGRTGAGDLDVAGITQLQGGVGFFGNIPFSSKPAVTGSRSSSSTSGALYQLLFVLNTYGLITDSSTT